MSISGYSDNKNAVYVLCVQRISRPEDHYLHLRHAGTRQRTGLGQSLEPLLERQRTGGKDQAVESSHTDTSCLAYSQVTLAPR